MTLEGINSPTAPTPPPQKNHNIINPDFNTAPVLHESSGMFTNKERSKRPRSNTPPPPSDYQSTNRHRSEIQLTAQEEYLAQILVMLRTGAKKSSDSDTLSQELEDNRHKCSVCNKAFTSYQALGGHMASHPKNTPIAIAEDHTNDAVKTTAVSNLNPCDRAHVCAICHRSFSTGQALGGHKRRHYEGNLNAGGGALSGSVVLSASVAAGSSQRRVFDFDLNLPAPPEEEDEAAAA